MKSIFRVLILAFFAAFSFSNDCCADTPVAKPPNILWLVGENMKLDLGIYGAKNVSTPHLDGLAEKGQRYTRVFSTSPVCAPSRSAFMDGMYQTTTDMHHMRSHRDDDYRLPVGVRPLTHRLQDTGYFTANIKQIGDKEVGTGKLDLNFVNEGAVYQSDDWSKLKDNHPHEINNLAGSPDPAHKLAILEMRTALDVWEIETGDRGGIPEPVGIVAPFEKEMHDWFGTPKWYKDKTPTDN